LVLSAIVLGKPAQELRAKLNEVVRKGEPQPEEIPPGLNERAFLGQWSE